MNDDNILIFPLPDVEIAEAYAKGMAALFRKYRDQPIRLRVGQVVVTPGTEPILLAADADALALVECLFRHARGDWGELDSEDTALNNQALDPADPSRILSAYTLPGGTRIWIITEWDRSATTVLLPEEY